MRLLAHVSETWTMQRIRKVRARNVKALADLVAEHQFTKGALAIDYDSLVARGVEVHS
jgi:hypothetical protein